MVLFLVAASLVVQIAAAFLAFLVLARWRRSGALTLGGAALTLALLVAASRRVYNLMVLLTQGRRLDLINEWFGMAFAVLSLVMVLSLWWWSRNRDVDGESSTQRETGRLTVWALGLGFVALIGSVGMGVYSYQASRDVLVREIHAQNLTMAHLLATDLSLDTQDAPSPKVLNVSGLKSHWAQVAGLNAQTFIVVIDSAGNYLIHTARPEKVGQSALAMRLVGDNPRVGAVKDLLELKQDWAGWRWTDTGDRQAVAFAYASAMDMYVGVNMAGAQFEGNVLRTVGPWLVGFGIITLVIFPAALIALHRAYSGTQRTLGATADALRESEERYRGLFTNTHAVMGLIDPVTQTLVDVNPAACEFYGYDRLRLRGLPITQLALMPPELLRQQVRECVEGRRHYFIQRHRLAGGAEREVEVFCGPLIIQGQTLLFAIVHDVTERRRTEEQLHLVSQAVQATSDAVGMSGPDGRAIYHNRAMYELLGYTVEELNAMGGPRCLFVHEEQVRRVYESRDRLGTWRGEVELRAKDGRIVPVLFRTDRILNEAGQLIGRVAVLTDVSERKRAEAALRQSQEALATMMRHLPGMAYRCANDEYWTMEFVSEGCEALTGWTPDDLRGNRKASFEKVIHPEDRALVRQAVERGLRAGRNYEMTYRIVTTTGEIKWVWEQGRGVYAPRGTLVALEGFIADITLTKQAEEHIRESEQRFRELVDHIDEAFWLLTPEGKLVYVSPAFARITGFQAEAATLDPWAYVRDLVVPEDRARMGEYLRGAMAGAHTTLEYRITRADGSIRWLHSRAFPIRDEAGRLSRIAGVVRDVTERREAEEALRTSEAKYRLLMEQAADGIFLIDSRGHFLEANPRGLEMLGMKMEDLQHRMLFDLIPEDDLKQSPPRLTDLRTGRTVIVERRLRRSDGTFVPTEISAKMLDDGKIMAMMRDISERRRAEEALRESEQRYRMLFNQMLNGCALHELVRDAHGRIVDLRYLDVNPGFELFTGLRRDEVVGKRMSELFPALEPDWMNQYRWVAETGEVRHFDMFAGPLRRHYEVMAFRPQPERLATIFSDVTERKLNEQALRQSEEKSRELAGRLHVLLRELDHRVKNNLAALYALIERYARTSGSVPAFAEAIRGKLMAMKAVHEIIARAGWQSVDLAHLLGDLAGQFVTPQRRAAAVVIEGPALQIAPRQASPLAMVLQELFVNCEKHGSYRSSEGIVRLTWQILARNERSMRVRLTWQEQGGPSITAPAAEGSGLGLKLVDGFARFELGGHSEMSFEPSGFRCVLECVFDITGDKPASASTGA